MKVRDIMTKEVTLVTAAQPITDVAHMMRQLDIGSLPVVQDGQLIGIITDRDIVVRAVSERADPRSMTVGDIASRDLVTIGPEQDLDEAVALMSRHRVRRLPVVQGRTLVGVLAQADVAMEAKEKKAGEMLEEISRPGSAPIE